VEIISLYRAVGLDEFYSIRETKQFSIYEGGVEVKYFGVNFEETLVFADMLINTNVVAIFEVQLPKKILDKIGDFTHVDPIIFKSGTVVIYEKDLHIFNAALIKIVGRL
jgi:hypothetical protein